MAERCTSTGQACSPGHKKALFAGLQALFLGLSLNVQAEVVSTQRAAELNELLHQDCGSCHGMKLTGGLGPALTRKALAGKPATLLAATIREGRPGTPMPPWKNMLSEAEIQWLVNTIQQYEEP